MHGFRGLLFDKDGTLFDFQETWGGWAADLMLDLAAGDCAIADDLADRIRLDRAGRRFHPDSVVIAGTSQDSIDALLPALPHLQQAQLAEILARGAETLEPVEAVPLRPLLERLRATGLRLGVATNDDEPVARAQLRRVGVLDLFEFVVGSDSGHGAKPAPGQCHAFAAATGLAADRVVMIGDSQHDLVAGALAGMATVAVLTGTATRDDLAPRADAVLTDIGCLPDWLGLS